VPSPIFYLFFSFLNADFNADLAIFLMFFGLKKRFLPKKPTLNFHSAERKEEEVFFENSLSLQNRAL